MASQAHDIFAPRRSFFCDAAVSKHEAVVLTTQGHITPVTVADTGIGIAARDCASGDDVDVILFGHAVLVLADASGAAVHVGDPLHINHAGNMVVQTAGLAFNAVALEALNSGIGYIEAVLQLGAAQAASASLGMVVDTAAGILAGEAVYASAAGHCDLIGAGNGGEWIAIGVAQSAAAHNAVVGVTLFGPLAYLLASTSADVAVGDTLELDGATSEFKTNDAGAGIAVALTANDHTVGAGLVLAVIFANTGI